MSKRKCCGICEDMAEGFKMITTEDFFAKVPALEAEIVALKAEVERLRGLCADMCDYIVACGGIPLDEWKAAERGEG